MAEDSKNKNNDSDYEDVCYICKRPERVAGRMIHIPNNINVCNDCMQKTFNSMDKLGPMFGVPSYMDFFDGKMPEKQCLLCQKRNLYFQGSR